MAYIFVPAAGCWLLIPDTRKYNPIFFYSIETLIMVLCFTFFRVNIYDDLKWRIQIRGNNYFVSLRFDSFVVFAVIAFDFGIWTPWFALFKWANNLFFWIEWWVELYLIPSFRYLEINKKYKNNISYSRLNVLSSILINIFLGKSDELCSICALILL